MWSGEVCAPYLMTKLSRYRIRSWFKVLNLYSTALHCNLKYEESPIRLIRLEWWEEKYREGKTTHDLKHTTSWAKHGGGNVMDRMVWWLIEVQDKLWHMQGYTLCWNSAKCCKAKKGDIRQYPTKQLLSLVNIKLHTERKQTNKQVKTKGSCSKGLSEHLKGGNIVFGDGF